MDNINVEVKLQKQIGDVKIVMLKGDDGASIASIDKTSTEGLVDTYTITLTDGRHTTFQVTNGSSIATIEKTASIGHTDIYTITLTDGFTSTFEVTNGDNWIDNDEKTATDFFETINGGLLSECKVALSPNQDLHGYENPWVGGANKNKLPLPTAETKNGITLTHNADGSVTLTGSSTGGAVYFDFYPNGDFDTTAMAGYIFSMFPENFSPSTTTISCRISDNTRSALQQLTNGSVIEDNGSGRYIAIRVSSGYDTNGIILKPMIRASGTSADFESYENICPISGHTQVEVEVGTNKLNPDNIVQGSLTTSAVSTRCSTRGNLTIPISVGQTITVSRQSSTINFAVAVTDSSMSVLFDSGWQSGSYTYISAYDGYVELVFAKQDGTDITPSNVKSANFMVEFGSTPSTYVPYTKGTYSLTVNLGGTYYSGTLDVVSGVFTPDTASQNVTSVSRNSATSYYASVSGEPAKVSNFDTVTSDKLPTSSDGAEVGVFINSQGAIRINTPNGYATSADMISAYGGSIQIVYELANPTPIQLSPTMVKALVGENHLSAPLEGQEIDEVKYRYVFTWDDVNGITDGLKDRIDDIEDVLAETSYTSAVACLVDDTTCTITDSNIKTTSLIEVFSSNSSGDTTVVTNIAVTNGQAVLTFDALVEATSFKLRITNL